MRRALALGRFGAAIGRSRLLGCHGTSSGAIPISRAAPALLPPPVPGHCSPFADFLQRGIQCRGYISESDLEDDEQNNTTSEDEEELVQENLSLNAEIPGDSDMIEIEPALSASLVNKMWTKILSVPQFRNNVVDIIKEWKTEGEPLKPTRQLLLVLSARLRRQKRFQMALQIYEWMFAERPCTTTDDDVLTWLYLTGRCGKFPKAEKILAELPAEYRNEKSYTVLLAAYTAANQVARAQLLWKRMRERDIAKTCHGYNLMFLMFRRNKLFGDFRSLHVEMVLSGVKPDPTTFYVLLAVKEEVGGFADIEKKAARELDRLELKCLRWSTVEMMMRVYGQLGDLPGVERMWCRLVKYGNVHTITYLCAIEAFGMAGAIAKSEEIFENLPIDSKEADRQRYYTLIVAYGRAGMAEKAEELLKRMLSRDMKPAAVAYNTVIQAFLRQNRLDRAVEHLEMAMTICKSPRGAKELCDGITAVLEGYARRGDVNAAEALVARCKDKQYFQDASLYNGLLRVYLNAQIPAAEIDECLKRQQLVRDCRTRRLLAEHEIMQQQQQQQQQQQPGVEPRC